MKLKTLIVIVCCMMGLQGLMAADWYVSAGKGDNKNPGTRDAPFKNIDVAIKKAAAGDSIFVAAGRYAGSFNIGFIEIDKGLTLKGGFSPDFSSWNPKIHHSLFQPDNASAAASRKPLISLLKNIDGFVLDGFILDAGYRNSYSASEGKPAGVSSGMLLLPPGKNGSENATVEEPLLRLVAGNQGGSIIIKNNLFLNGANFGIQGGIPKGKIEIKNNIFVSNRMAAIELWGIAASVLAEAEISDNSILFSWSRLKDFMDMGYGIRIMTKMKYSIKGNIIGTSVLSGIDHTRFAKDEHISLDKNLFFLNRRSDLEYSPKSNTKLNLNAQEFAELAFSSVSGNLNEAPHKLPLDRAYLEAFLAARYAEKADYDANSAANQARERLGLSKQGKISSVLSMFGNRYPWEKALELYGAIPGYGAQ